jgi:O-antigen/teichoic acid export membrane protein
LFGQTAIYGFGTVVPRLLNYLLLTPFFTRIFDQEAYGVITELYAYVVFLMILLTYGMETGYFRFAQLRKDDTKVFSTSLVSVFVSSLAFVVLILLVSVPVSRMVGYGNHPEYIRWIGIIVGVDAFTAIPYARLRWQNRATRFAVIKTASVLLNIGLNFLFLLVIPSINSSSATGWLGSIYNPERGVGYVFVSNIASSLFAMALLSGTIASVRPYFVSALWIRMIGYSFPLLVSGMAGTVNEALDRVLLKHLLRDPETALAQLGIYGANYKIAVLMTLFVQMFRYASEPFYFSNADKPNAKTVYAQVMKYFIIAALFIYLAVNLYIDIFKHFIGKGFHEGLHIVPVVLFANLLLGIFFNLSIWYKLNNLTRYGALITLMGAVITLAVNWVFIPLHGYTASAWAHVACYGSMVAVSWWIGRKYYPISYPLKSIAFYTGLATVMYLAASQLREWNAMWAMVINTLMLSGFIIIVILFERKNIARLRFESSSEARSHESKNRK